MILETVEHMKGRGVSLRWFPSLEGSTIITTDTSTLYAPSKVCKFCYDLYVTEQKVGNGLGKGGGVEADDGFGCRLSARIWGWRWLFFHT